MPLLGPRAGLRWFTLPRPALPPYGGLLNPSQQTDLDNP